MENTSKRGFKRKTIEQNIKTKMTEWIKTLPENMHKDVTSNYIVTGGAITSMLLGDLPNDYDVYFKTSDIAQKVSNYYINKLVTDEKVSNISTVIEEGRVRIIIKSAGIAVGDQTSFNDYQYFESLPPNEAEAYFDKHAYTRGKDYDPVLITSNAISLKSNVQIIIRFVGAPEEIHKNYDFVHCTNWYTQDEGLILKPEALEATLARELKYVGSRYPLCSMFRLKKFIRRGWSITAGEMLKIAWDISDLNLNDMDVLREQLVGVDQAYFAQLLSCLRQENKPIDRTYLWEVVNRVFDSNEFEDLGFSLDNG